MSWAHSEDLRNGDRSRAKELIVLVINIGDHKEVYR